MAHIGPTFRLYLYNKFHVPKKNTQRFILFPQFRHLLTRCGALQQSARCRKTDVIGEHAEWSLHWIAA
jgi:hypothetical protein